MKGWLFAAALVVLLLVAAALTERQPWAAVTVIFGNERVSANFAFLLLALVGVLISLRLLAGLFELPARLIRARRKRRAQRLREEFDQGILLYIQGHYEQAQRCFLKASQERPLDYTARLLAASCALARRNFSEVREALQAAQAANVKDNFSVGLIQSEMLLESGQDEQALAHLEKLCRRQPDNRKLIDLLIRACESTGRWESPAAALPKLRKLYREEPDRLRAIETAVARRMLQLAAKRMSEGDLLRQWRGTDRLLQPQLLVDYARLLVGIGAAHTARNVLAAAIESDWAWDCIVCYGELEGIDTEQRIQRVERWLRDRPNDPALLLCLGKLHCQAESWERAARCLKRSLQLSPRPQTGEALGRVLKHLDENGG